MAKNISKEEYEYFDNCLLAETNLLEQWFINKVFTEGELEAGTEIELFLLKNNYAPAAENLQFIDIVNKPFLIPEVGKAHLEINSCHTPLTGDCLSILHRDILKSWKESCVVARNNQYHLALIGSLITATEKYHQKKYLTDKQRYTLINRCLKQQSNGQPISLHIEGDESLIIRPESLAMNGLISAFQLHIQMGLSQSVRYYNTAQAIAGPMLALCCNSPFMFGQQLWSDSRVPIFDQMMTIPHFDRAVGLKCCLFGNSYLSDSLFELFAQNYQFFPRLIPESAPNSPTEDMFHLRRQNGVIYRWNRPVVDFNAQKKPHLRIEHRGPSTGPTVIDMIANAAFYYGLLNYFAIGPVAIEHLLPFHSARTNFFQAARYGLNADFTWFSEQTISAVELLKSLIPLAHKGLLALDLSLADINFYLSVVERRVALKTNGSHWQCQFIKKYGKDFSAMMASYLQNQYQELPISEWLIR